MQHHLDGIDLLDGLGKSQKEALVQRSYFHSFAEKEQIIDFQDKGRDVYFIVEGKVRVVNYSLSGREISFDDLNAGNCFGELAAIDGGPRSANVIALVPTTVAVISPRVFTEFLEEHPGAAMKVMKRLSHIVRTATERIMDLSTLGANNRVHAEILRQAMANMSSTNSAEIRPIPHHSEIASRVSTTRETVARVLSDLAHKNIVKRTRNAFIVADVRRLAAMIEDVRGD